MNYGIYSQWQLFRKVIKTEFQPYEEKYGIKGIDLKLLFHLYMYPEMDTLTALTNDMYINKGQASRSMDRLNKKGLISISPDRKDRRYVHFSLTKEAEALACSIKQDRYEISLKITQDIPEEKKQIFMEVIHMIQKNMEHILEEGK